MVRRFNDHDSVLRRVIEYYNNAKLNKAQTDYMRRIIMETARTEYTITLDYDKDIKRGCERAKAFDSFLKEAAPDIYRNIVKDSNFLKTVRFYRFNPALWGLHNKRKELRKRRIEFYKKIKEKKVAIRRVAGKIKRILTR